MLKSRDPKLAEAWRVKIEDWRQSGKSMAEWCRECHINPHHFYYWKGRWGGDKRNPPSARPEFLELNDHPSPNSQITIEYQGITIRLESNFDETALLRCLKVIGRSVCSR